MGISFSNIGTVGREQLITSGSNGEPNWSYIPSKGKSTKTQNEFVSEIKKMAQKAVNATDKTEQDAISRQVLQLRAEYLSEVAPDRKQLYQQAKSAMKNQNANPKCKGIGELTLLDFLEQAEGKNQKMAGVEEKDIDRLLANPPEKVEIEVKYKIAVTVMELRFWLKDCELPI